MIMMVLKIFKSGPQEPPLPVAFPWPVSTNYFNYKTKLATIIRCLCLVVILAAFPAVVRPNHHHSNSYRILDDLSCDFNDATLCKWILNDGQAQFRPMFNQTDVAQDHHQMVDGEEEEPEPQQEEEKVLFFTGPTNVSIESPTLDPSDDYELIFSVNMNFIGHILVVIRERQIESQILKVNGDRQPKWQTYSVGLPKYPKMNILLEIKFTYAFDGGDYRQDDYVAFEFIKVVDKKLDYHRLLECDFHCSNGDDHHQQCVSNQSVCNIFKECANGRDEEANCDKLPRGSYCTFDDDFCSWFNYDESHSNGQWIHEPDRPHGGYLGAVFTGTHRFASISYLKSPPFEPIPFYHSFVSSKYFKKCQARFSYMFRSVSIDLALELEPLPDNVPDGQSPSAQKTKSIQLWRYFNKNKISRLWENVTVTMPINYHHRYRLKFGAALGLKSASTFSQRIYVAIDNFSLSKACFGIDVPETEPRVPAAFVPNTGPERVFSVPKPNKSIKSFLFTSCGANGNTGPTYSQCESFYLNTTTRAAIFENKNLNVNGSQMWTVPRTGYYTMFAKGADGGRGLYKHPGGKGSLVRAVFHFQEGDTIFLVIGQPGGSVCSAQTNDALEQCRYSSSSATSKKIGRRLEIGGGGGGATYVFKYSPNSEGKWHPLLIAGGGGGGSGKFNPNFKLSSTQHGREFDIYNPGWEGDGDGAGGGWNTSGRPVSSPANGQSLLAGGQGGMWCQRFAKWRITGGFGGGGASCPAAGGGGGFHGGNVNPPAEAGDGGTSYVDFRQSFLQLFSDPELAMMVHHDENEEPESGYVMIIPQVDDCCNDGQYPCVIVGQQLLAAGANNSTTKNYCICGPDNFLLDSCLFGRARYAILLWTALLIIGMAIFLIAAVLLAYQRRNSKKKQALANNGNELSDVYLLSNSSSTDAQLSRLRSHNAIITEYNPNYEFGGSTCTLGDLREIPREKLNLVKALGQGAFGEVYQGLLQNMPEEGTDQLPVAVKTLPEYSANKQAEMDFLMEALIMSKFKHKNIVRFIGICFEKMPRFIILELLPGGDMKTFLRENRATLDKPSTLVMGDLLVMALDVASGCNYLEENHFIHRDIAARNCLLTSKVKMNVGDPMATGNMHAGNGFNLDDYKNGFNNSGIVVKIADFGMARDIYRADYYRKGGKAMLPVKWMPPEAFLDGVFTSKTDVWSFGVLLWEVMSMGYMPYPGRGNQEVMQMVTAGGRLEAPNSLTPAPIYAIMAQCWNATPEFRPNFSTIIERIGYCLQDPDVLNTRLPIFHRAASVEKDLTMMRPPPEVTDYLIPNNLSSQTNSNYSVATEKTELLSPDTCSTLSCPNDQDKLLELDQNHNTTPTAEIRPPNHQANNQNYAHVPAKSWNMDNMATGAHSNLPCNNHHHNDGYNNGGMMMMDVSSPAVPPLPSSLHLQHHPNEIIMNPNRLNDQHPSVRYVNVNVNPHHHHHHYHHQHSSNGANVTSTTPTNADNSSAAMFQSTA